MMDYDVMYAVDEGKNHLRNPVYREAKADPNGMFGEEGLTFGDVLDIVNPLQHIPLVNILYRELTGDTIKPAARMIGGGLFFGPVGVLASAANVVVEETTGKDIGGTLLAMATGEELTPPNREPDQQLAAAGSAVADVTPEPAPATAAAPTMPLPPAAPGSFGGIATLPGQSARQTAPAAATPVNLATADPVPAATSPIAAAPAASPTQNLAAAVGGPTSGIPSGATGTTKVGLPVAGAMTPAATTLAVSQMAPDAMPTGSSPMLAAAAAGAQGTAGAPRSLRRQAVEMPAPERTNNVTPKMPHVLSHQGVGREPAHVPNRGNLARADNMPPTILNPVAMSANAAATPTAGVASDAMLRALDKYDALLKARRGAGAEVDRRL